MALAMGLGEWSVCRQAAWGAQPGPTAPAANLVLGNTSIWRCCFVLRKPIVRVGEELKEVRPRSYSGVWVVSAASKVNEPGVTVFDTPAPPANWTVADFMVYGRSAKS
jgi:hypothetical protein